MEKLKPFEDIMQKDTFKNIKPLFFQFQGILTEVGFGAKVLRTDTSRKNWLSQPWFHFCAYW